MKKLLLALAILLLPSAALAQKTKAALAAEVNTNFASTGNITAATLRTTVLDIINSYYDLNGLTAVSCGSNTFVSAFPTLSSATCTQPSVSNISGFGANVAAFLGTPSSGNLAAAITDETGTGVAVFGTSPNITTPTGIVKGDVGLGNVANVDTTNAANISSGVLAAARGGWGATGAWSTSTPTPTCNVGAGTWTGTFIGFRTVDKTTFISVHLVLSAIGTCSGIISVTIPVTEAGIGATMIIRENSLTGTAYQGWISPGSNTLSIATMAGAGPTLASGDLFIGSTAIQNQ